MITHTHGSVAPAYYLLIVPVVAILLPYSLLLRDKALPPAKGRIPDEHASLPRLSLGGRAYANFRYVCITRFLLILGFNVGTAYLLKSGSVH